MAQHHLASAEVEPDLVLDEVVGWPDHDTPRSTSYSRCHAAASARPLAQLAGARRMTPDRLCRKAGVAEAVIEVEVRVHERQRKWGDPRDRGAECLVGAPQGVDEHRAFVADDQRAIDVVCGWLSSQTRSAISSKFTTSPGTVGDRPVPGE
jgi:hypothetical protein